jgi:hypothetical protein
MGDVIIVKPSRGRGILSAICSAVYRFFTWIGEGILRFPNKIFYVVLIILCFLAPVFSILLVIALLCVAYRRGTVEF